MRSQHHRKALDRPDPKLNMRTATMFSSVLAYQIVREAPGSDLDGVPTLSPCGVPAYAFVDKDVRVDGGADRQHESGMPGSVSVRPSRT